MLGFLVAICQLSRNIQNTPGVVGNAIRYVLLESPITVLDSGFGVPFNVLIEIRKFRRDRNDRLVDCLYKSPIILHSDATRLLGEENIGSIISGITYYHCVLAPIFLVISVFKIQPSFEYLVFHTLSYHAYYYVPALHSLMSLWVHWIGAIEGLRSILLACSGRRLVGSRPDSPDGFSAMLLITCMFGMIYLYYISSRNEIFSTNLFLYCLSWVLTVLGLLFWAMSYIHLFNFITNYSMLTDNLMDNLIKVAIIIVVIMPFCLSILNLGNVMKSILFNNLSGIKDRLQSWLSIKAPDVNLPEAAPFLVPAAR
ncbi:hypothetical protein NECID01_0431 [Nematocida sp. AWRm77]|nr:hypothetical protein NECID01_0431 [Nematocida sp. AWRm77]